MSLEDKISQDYIAAMKERNSFLVRASLRNDPNMALVIVGES